MSAPSADPPLNIVLVDDDEAGALNVRRAFARAGIASRVFAASDGVEGLELLRSSAVPKQRRVVLLDLDMPRMSGLEFLGELRKDPALALTPVVVLTGSRDARDKQAAWRQHVAGYFLKPTSFRSFVELMVAVDCYWSSVEL